MANRLGTPLYRPNPLSYLGRRQNLEESTTSIARWDPNWPNVAYFLRCKRAGNKHQSRIVKFPQYACQLLRLLPQKQTARRKLRRGLDVNVKSQYKYFKAFTWIQGPLVYTRLPKVLFIRQQADFGIWVGSSTKLPRLQILGLQESNI